MIFLLIFQLAVASATIRNKYRNKNRINKFRNLLLPGSRGIYQNRREGILQFFVFVVRFRFAFCVSTSRTQGDKCVATTVSRVEQHHSITSSQQQ